MIQVFKWFPALLILFTFTTCPTTSAAEKTRLIVSGDYDFSPFEFTEDGKPTGFNIDLIRAVADVMDLDIEIRLGPWASVRRDLAENKTDIVTGMVYSEQRGKLFHFSVPHTKITPALFVRDDSTLYSLADIEGKEIIVQEDDIMHELLLEKFPAQRIITVPNYPEALRLIASGKYDGALLASELHKYFIASKLGYRNLKEVRLEIPPLDYCFAVAQHNKSLLFKLDRGLIILKSNGSYQQIYNKWFGIYEEKKIWDTIKLYLFALVLIIASFIVSLLWSWSLRRRVSLQTAELRANENELLKAHEELEQRVLERTHELAQSNDRLKSEISERKKAEVALRESEASYRAIVEGFDGQIYICSADNRIEFMNQNLIDRTGNDATGELCYRALHDKNSICQWCCNDLVLNGETVRWEIQNPKDNRWYYVVNTPIYHTDGTVSKQAMIQDITERVEAEQQRRKLEVQNRRLQKVESLDRMAAAVAHHFNNKLHVVMGQLELAIQSLNKDNHLSSYINAASEAADQAAEVSRQMLTYLGKVTGIQTPVDLSEICKRTLPAINTAMPDKVTLYTKLPTPGPSIKANTSQIQLILSNIIRNAWEAIESSEGTIHLTVKKADPSTISPVHRFPINWQAGKTSYGCIEVKDTGCGIEPEDIEAAFDPFFSTKFTGRGLGLSVVLGIVQAHNGAATVASKQGEGTTISVFFPLSIENVLHETDSSKARSTTYQPGTVLLVDDDDVVLEITGAMLERLGFQILTAEDGIEGLEVLRQHLNEIQLVLTDFAMPRMNGLTMLTPLKEIAPEMPVILASGYSEERVLDSTHKNSPEVFLEKPYGMDELKKAIHDSLAIVKSTSGNTL